MTQGRWIALGVALLVLLAGWSAGGAWSSGKEPLGTVESGDLVLSAEVSGTLKSVNSEAISPPQVPGVWDFKISMLIPEGKDVKPGDPVVGFDTAELQRKLLEKQAESESAGKHIEKKMQDAEIEGNADRLRLAEAEARRHKAQLTLEVPADLAKSQDLKAARLELEDAEREITFVRATIDARTKADEVALAALRRQKDAADRRVKDIQDAIASMSVRATRAGTVVYEANWRDEKKKVGDPAWNGERILEIPDLSRMRAEGEIAESDAGMIKEGQVVRLRLEAHPDVEYTGKIALIWGTVQQLSWRNPEKVVKLDISLDSTDPRRMRPGMRFRGTVETGRVKGAVLVPAEAVFPTPDGPVAYRKSIVGFGRRVLELGARNDKMVVVTHGLEPGDRVSRRDLSLLEDGS